MNATLRSRRGWWAALAAVSLLSFGCGGSSSPQPGTVNLMLSDASTEDWSTIGVKVLSIALTPQGGGSPVTVYTAPSPAPVVNLVQLDHLSELLANVAVPAGTYARATITIAANAGDVLLTASADPSAGFAGTPGQTVPSADIRIRGATGTLGNLTVPVPVTLESPLVVTSGQTSPLDLEFDLSNPVFLVDHVPAGGGAPIWVVSFDGPVRHHPIRDVARVVLRHVYGSVTSVAQNGASITFTRVHPRLPASTPEVAVPTSHTLEILPDVTYGTRFYDLDAKSEATLPDFSSLATTLAGKYVRVAARYESDGTLVAVRVWASASFQKVWVNPEGHVLQADATNGVLTVATEDGGKAAITVDAATSFFFRTPEKALADTTPIGTGAGFLANVQRGFKVHVGVVDPLASPLVARTVDIEIARFDGSVSSPGTSGFTCTRQFATATDDYAITLPYISSTTPNGADAAGNLVSGFKWWDFAFPQLADTGASAIGDFVQATDGSVSFGGTVPALSAWGVTYARWNDPANPGGWAADLAVLAPTPVPLGSVAVPWSSVAGGGTFGVTVTGGANTVPVDVSTITGAATLVYQVDKTGTVVTISRVDPTTTTGLATVASSLAAGTPVKVYGVPQPDGSIKAYVLLFFTGTAPAI